ncbi:serine/threonine-protein kinase DCLK3 [Thalassophryne amazonica]|uniref:serine/threonine-protein kinase DCLK3 n=1 Tax=Thalassophryne amazonica TaxID=390379 RepID=UPI001471A52D|nr:serine/threonine-protein kinase DCLK3 [Thalassophryne amazonica]
MQRARYGCEAARKGRTAAPPMPLMKRAGGVPQLWPIRPHPTGQIHKRTHCPVPPPPHLPLFHTRHAEESANRPHLITVVWPCGPTALRKVTVLLNRRGVVSFEQLLLDISEALGFPRWHRARVTRLFTPHAQEVKGVYEFFRGEVAFLALGKARPELSSVQEALEELFPEHSHYQADALRAWEKKLRPAPDKAAKDDSGYSEGTDSSGTQTNQDTQLDTNVHVKKHNNVHVSARPLHHTDTQQVEKSDPQKSHKTSTCRKAAHIPNHLQRLYVKGGVRERQPSVIGLFKQEKDLREVDASSPTLCENCLARRAKYQSLQFSSSVFGRVPLPPVLKKQKAHFRIEQEVGMPALPISLPTAHPSIEDKNFIQSHLSRPFPGVGSGHKDLQQGVIFDLPSDGRDVTLSDIERCYEIGRIVGDGNFAVVRECCHRDSGQTMAMKIVERSKLIGREHMMQNELSLLAILCHPRIVRLLAHHHTHTHSYLVMELVSGGDLFEAISEKGKFAEAEAGLMVSDVSEALNYIHCKSIVHRDIKPENLLIEDVTNGSCRLKLGDFGLAMVVTEPVFTICGTPTYVAPEILSETGYGVAVDVWALGVILYILLCGFPPFRSRDRNEEELFQLIKKGQFHFLSPYWDPISEEARGLIRDLLQPDPSLRLTAEQTLLHPWVKTMASVCQQMASTNKAQQREPDMPTEPQRVKSLDQNGATEPQRSRGPAHSSRDGINSTELTSHDGRQTDVTTPTAQIQAEHKPPQQSSTNTSTVHNIYPEVKVNTHSK